MVKHTEICLNCLSVFDHFVGLALTGLTPFVGQPFHKTNSLSSNPASSLWYSKSLQLSKYLQLYENGKTWNHTGNMNKRFYFSRWFTRFSELLQTAETRCTARYLLIIDLSLNTHREREHRWNFPTIGNWENKVPWNLNRKDWLRWLANIS